MSQFTQANPGSRLEISQIHNKGISIEGKVYYGRAQDGSVHKYRGTFERRLKDETNLISNEDHTKDNTDKIDEINIVLDDHEERIVIIEETLPTKADKCFAIAMAIALG